MRYDPQAAPWWEQERGGGPVTDWMRVRRRIEAKARLKEIDTEIRTFRATGNLQQIARVVPPLEAEREALRAELGYLRLVREVA